MVLKTRARINCQFTERSVFSITVYDNRYCHVTAAIHNNNKRINNDNQYYVVCANSRYPTRRWVCWIWLGTLRQLCLRVPTAARAWTAVITALRKSSLAGICLSRNWVRWARVSRLVSSFSSCAFNGGVTS